MNEFITIEQIDQLGNLIKSKTSQSPEIGMILGSGLGPLANEVKNADIIPYQELPGWPVSTIVGHVGQRDWRTGRQGSVGDARPLSLL